MPSASKKLAGRRNSRSRRHLALEVALGERRALVGRGAARRRPGSAGRAWPRARSRATSEAPAWPAPTTTIRAVFGSMPRPSPLASLPRPSICRAAVSCNRREGRSDDDRDSATGCPRRPSWRRAPDGIAPVPAGELFAGRRVVLFGLPGAFTGMCSTQHVPSFIRVADAAAREGRRRDRLRRGQRPARDAGLGRGDAAPARPGSACCRTPARSFTRALGLDLRQPGARAVRPLEALCAAGRGRGGEGAEPRGEQRPSAR